MSSLHSNLTTAKRIKQRKYSVSRNTVRHLSAEMLQKLHSLWLTAGAAFLWISTIPAPQASQCQLGHAKTDAELTP